MNINGHKVRIETVTIGKVMVAVPDEGGDETEWKLAQFPDGWALVQEGSGKSIALTKAQGERLSRLLLPVVALSEWCELHAENGPISRHTASDWARNGKIPVYKSGRDWLIKPTVLPPSLGD